MYNRLGSWILMLNLVVLFIFLGILICVVDVLIILKFFGDLRGGDVIGFCFEVVVVKLL